MTAKMTTDGDLNKFLELEGLPIVIDDKILFTISLSYRGRDNGADDEIRPNSAYSLTNAEVYAEMEKYGIKSTGFVDTDRAVLQRVFDEELERDMEIIKERKKKEKLETVKQTIVAQRVDAMVSSARTERDEIRKDSSDIIGFMLQNKTSPFMRLSFNTIETRVLAKCLCSNSNLLVLDLSDNDCSDHSCSYIARSLIRNSVVRDLNLSHNRAASLTCRAFGESLTVNSSLKVLDLSDNPIGSLAIRQIANDKPDVCCTLGMEVGVETNESTIFSQFCNALAVNCNLMTVSMKRTGLSSQDQEAAVLISCLRRNTSVFDVDLSFNQLTQVQEEEVARILRRNRNSCREMREAEFKQALKNLEYETHQREMIESQKKASSRSSYLDQKRIERAENWAKKEEDEQSQAKEVMIAQRQKDVDKLVAANSVKKVEASASASKKK